MAAHPLAWLLLAAAALAGCERNAAPSARAGVDPPAATPPPTSPEVIPPSTTPQGMPPSRPQATAPASPERAPGVPAASVPGRPRAAREPQRPATAQPGDPEGARLLAQRRLVVPVQGVRPDELTDTYHAARDGGEHEALDIVAPAGTPVVAVDDGTIAKLFDSRTGGRTVYQFDVHGQLAYYYAHLDSYAPGLREGLPVKRGQALGTVGSTGNADPGTPHLHFGVFALGPEQRWWEGEPVNPYPALRRAGPATQQEETLAAR